jgi:hypothetical protein
MTLDGEARREKPSNAPAGWLTSSPDARHPAYPAAGPPFQPGTSALQ